MSILRILILFIAPAFLLSACAQTQLGAHVGKEIFNESQTQGTFKVGNPYNVKGKEYRPKETYNFTQTGVASWYGPGFHGKKTANGEVFNKYELTAAHKTLQMPSLIEVTNLENGKSVILRVNDRGPFAQDRILDVSERGAELLGFKNQGTTKIKIKLLPIESKELADIAKSGQSTRGMEVAYNNGTKQIKKPSVNYKKPALPTSQNLNQPVQLVAVEREELIDPFPQQSAIKETETVIAGNISDDGRFMPAPVIKDTLHPSGNIYIQAGAFGNATNAHALSGRLGSIAPSNVTLVSVNGSMLHRVRLGPFADMAQAQSALNRVAANGQTNALILVE